MDRDREATSLRNAHQWLAGPAFSSQTCDDSVSHSQIRNAKLAPGAMQPHHGEHGGGKGKTLWVAGQR